MLTHRSSKQNTNRFFKSGWRRLTCWMHARPTKNHDYTIGIRNKKKNTDVESLKCSLCTYDEYTSTGCRVGQKVVGTKRFWKKNYFQNGGKLQWCTFCRQNCHRSIVSVRFGGICPTPRSSTRELRACLGIEKTNNLFFLFVDFRLGIIIFTVCCVPLLLPPPPPDQAGHERRLEI